MYVNNHLKMLNHRVMSLECDGNSFSFWEDINIILYFNSRVGIMSDQIVGW